MDTNPRRELILITRIAAIIVGAVTIAYILACSEQPRAVYISDHGICRYSSTGSDAPSELCYGLPRPTEAPR